MRFIEAPKFTNTVTSIDYRVNRFGNQKRESSQSFKYLSANVSKQLCYSICQSFSLTTFFEANEFSHIRSVNEMTGEDV